MSGQNTMRLGAFMIVCYMVVVISEATVTVPEVVSGSMEDGGTVPDVVSGTLRSQGDASDNAACRFSFDVTLCVMPPVDPDSEVKMCPFKLCGPSYVKADECAIEDDTKPERRCGVQTLTTFRWECIGHGKKEMAETPMNCEGPDCLEKETCACEFVKVDKMFLSDSGPFKGSSVPCPVAINGR